MDTKMHTAHAEAVGNTLGGELVSYKLDGQEYVWQGLPEYWASHAPVLFPTVGATIDETVKFEGKPYPLKKHGFARKQEFRLIEATGDKLVYELVDNEESHKVYPYKFCCSSRIRSMTTAFPRLIRSRIPMMAIFVSVSAVIRDLSAR